MNEREGEGRKVGRLVRYLGSGQVFCFLYSSLPFYTRLCSSMTFVFYYYYYSGFKFNDDDYYYYCTKGNEFSMTDAVLKKLLTRSVRKMSSSFSLSLSIVMNKSERKFSIPPPPVPPPVTFRARQIVCCVFYLLIREKCRQR